MRIQIYEFSFPIIDNHKPIRDVDINGVKIPNSQCLQKYLHRCSNLFYPFNFTHLFSPYIYIFPMEASLQITFSFFQFVCYLFQNKK